MSTGRVLLTGAGGFLGRHVAAELAARRHSLKCLVRDTAKLSSLREQLGADAKRVESWDAGSLVEPIICDDAVSGCDAIVHVAAGMSGSTSSLFLDTVVSTRNLVDAALRHRVRKFVLVSSLAVYGTWPLRRGAVLDENCPLEPNPQLRDAYSFSKVEQERLCWAAHADRGLPLAVVRPGVIYGPGRGFMSARVGLPVGDRIFLQLAGSNRLPYTYVRNCADAIVSALESDRCIGEALNIVDDELPRGRELLALHRARMGVPPKVIRVPSRAIPAVARSYEFILSRSDGMLPPALTRYRAAAQWKPLRYPNQKAKHLLGWQPRIGLRAGLASC
jgi:nucleoside-diphosphate-sugar epimerase